MADDGQPLVGNTSRGTASETEGSVFAPVGSNTRIEMAGPKQVEKIHKLTGTQGKVAELRQQLTNSGKKDKNHAAKREALKKIIANMTMSNNDMVALFPDVLACMAVENLEVKKMSRLSTSSSDLR